MKLPLEVYCILLFIIPTFKMASSLRNIIVVGGSFVGRVSPFTPRFTRLENNTDFPADYRSGACKSDSSDTQSMWGLKKLI
jgi:hypothetical protein